MTEQTGQELALPSDMETGLEGFDQSDMVVPRLNIIHKEGEFEDSLTNERFQTLERVILLGLVKQRILWPERLSESSDPKPMCKSNDHAIGFPNVDEDTRRDERFPWPLSGFNADNYDLTGQPELACEGCKLKDWGSHPDGKKPFCAEVYTFPLLYDPNGNDQWLPAIVSFQKTGLKTTKNYLSAFARSGTPLFASITKIGLDLNQRGDNKYSTPRFQKIGDTPQSDWREYSTSFTQMRTFLQRKPRSEEDDGGSAAPATDNVNRQPETKSEPPAKTEPPAETPPADATPASEDRNKLPF